MSRSTSPSLVVVTVILGTLTVSLNNSALNPAIPEFMTVFDIGPTTATWIVAGFMVSMGVTMPVTGFLGQKFGKRAVFLFGLCLFLLGSCVGAVASSINWVIVARVMQGVAGGLMMPLSLALIFSVYPKDKRGKVVGIWGSAVMLAPAIGPVIGGIFIEFFGWQSLFLMNIPVGAAGIAIGLYGLPKVKIEPPSSFDWQGFILITLGISLLMLILSRIKTLEAFGDPINLCFLVLSVLLLVVFVRVELNKKSPLLNIRLFSIPTYRLSVLVAVVQFVAMFECLILLPLLMQLVMGLSAVWTGAALLCTAVFASIFVNLGGRILDKKGPRGVVFIGLFLTACATTSFGFLNEQSSLLTIFVLMMLRGVGIGLSYMPASTAGLNSIPEEMVTQGSAMNNISRRIISSAAIILASIYIEMRTTQQLNTGGEYLASYLVAVNETYIATGLLIFLTLPFALLMTGAKKNEKKKIAVKTSTAC